MTLEPRLFDNDDPADELPADIAELGVQLSDDAEYLARTYPAPTRSDPPRRDAATANGWWRAAAMILFLGLGILFGRSLSEGEPGPADNETLKLAPVLVDSVEANALAVNEVIDDQNRSHLQEVAVNPSSRSSLGPGSEIEMLQKQLAAFEEVIRRLQDQLKRREQDQAETDKLIKSLRSEIQELRAQVQER